MQHPLLDLLSWVRYLSDIYHHLHIYEKRGDLNVDRDIGDSARRLVGMLLPKGAEDDLLHELHEQRELEAQGALSQKHHMSPAEMSRYHFGS